MPINYHADRLIKALEERALCRDIIERIIDSGYILRDWGDLSGRTWTTVSDRTYGNKQFSSSFDVDDFVKYAKGEYLFPALPPFVTVENCWN